MEFFREFADVLGQVDAVVAMVSCGVVAFEGVLVAGAAGAAGSDAGGGLWFHVREVIVRGR